MPVARSHMTRKQGEPARATRPSWQLGRPAGLPPTVQETGPGRMSKGKDRGATAARRTRRACRLRGSRRPNKQLTTLKTALSRGEPSVLQPPSDGSWASWFMRAGPVVFRQCASPSTRIEYTHDLEGIGAPRHGTPDP